MTVSIEKDEINRFYDLARESFFTCLKNPENGFLQEEVPFPLEDIKVAHDKLKIVFNLDEVNTYVLEIELIIQDASAGVIGSYKCIVDKNGDALDDVLVIH